jgi:hypothetical protein
MLEIAFLDFLKMVAAGLEHSRFSLRWLTGSGCVLDRSRSYTTSRRCRPAAIYPSK